MVKRAGTPQIIRSRPPQDKTAITNIYWDPDTEQIVVDHD